ncbi:MAG: 2-dehydropantoate 2-reductase [Eubacteriales bacterium]|nr:2-dehydropantoate 2-reductase [Eubacteriales bacterium]
MRIGFLGCGAIGSIYSGYMTKAHEVCIVDTYAPVVEEVRANGIRIDECVPGVGNGETSCYRPAIITTDPKEIGRVDILIVFVRYMFLEAAVRNALPMIGPDTIVMTLQNGIGNYDEIAKVIPEEQIVIGNTSHGSTGMGPGHVKHTGMGKTFIGTLKAPMEKAEKAAAALREAGFEVDVMDNVMNVIWHKVLINVGINAITALLEQQNAFINDNQYAHEAARLMVEEALDVAIASGCQFDRAAELENVYKTALATGTNKSSSLQDILNHKETEIRIINGAVSKTGREVGIATPYNDFICQLVLAKQSVYLGR